MDPLAQTVAAAFCSRFDAFLAQATGLCGGLSEDEFWTRPYPYGNSIGHLLLHVTGNLNFFIGTHMAGTGYVRDRDREFTDASRRPKADVLADLAASVSMVQQTVRAQSAADWVAPYSAPGLDDPNRFAVVLRCTHHFHHHLGQIIYLAKAHAVRRAQE
jgi:hypothetical protein